MEEIRRFHLYYGEGKGKTTAAFGLALRALGCGLRVLIVQLLKETPSGEIKLLEAAGALVLRGMGTEKFVFQMSDIEKRRVKKTQNDLLLQAQKKLKQRTWDMLIIDEAAGAWETEMIDREQLQLLVKENKEKTEIILTGRVPAPWMLADADYITEMRCVKHPYEKGLAARQGIEY